MSDTGKITPPVIRPGNVKSKSIVVGAITGVRILENGAFRVTEDGEPSFRQTEDQ